MKIIFIIILFALTACTKDISEKNRVTTINPFKLFTPDFNKAREQNDIFQEWTIRNFVLGVHKYRTLRVNKKDSVDCIRSGSAKFPVAFHFLAQYRIPLPESAKKMNINMEYGYQTFNNAELLLSISFLNKTTLLRTNTFPLEPTLTINNTAPGIVEKEIEINIPSSANNILIQLTAEKGVVLLGRCDIAINEKNIAEYSFDQTLPFSSSEIEKIQTRLSSQLQIHDKVKITGIGESLHGSMEFIQQATTVIKEKISTGDNHILLLEASPLIGFQLNEYVQGKNTDLTHLMSMEKNGYNCNLFIDFLDYIKKYNQEKPGKVIVAGYETGINTSLDSLFSKVAALFPESEEIQDCSLLLNEIANLNKKENITLLSKDQMKRIRLPLEIAIKKANTKGTFYESYIYNYLLELVNNSGSLYDFKFKYMHKRDSLMAGNICYLLKQLPDSCKAIIHGHLGHIAKHREKRELKGNFTSSLGYYLFQKYGTNYKVVGLFTGYGEVWTGRYKGYDTSLKKGIYPVLQPIGKSMEQLGNALDTTSFYLNDIKDLSLLDKIVYERTMGAFWQPMQFEPTNLRQELDAIWFTPRCTAL